MQWSSQIDRGPVVQNSCYLNGLLNLTSRYLRGWSVSWRMAQNQLLESQVNGPLANGLLKS